VTILAILQNQWFKNPERMRMLLESHYKDRHERFVSDFLFFGCTTGARLRSSFGEELCERIVWENSSLEIGDNPNSKFRHDPEHIKIIVSKFKPSVVITLGDIAKRAIKDYGVDEFTWLHGPHPASRGGGVKDRLSEIASILEEMLDSSIL